MGLSRNKVAVSEGAAGSPPFYGECGTERSEIIPDRICVEQKSPVAFSREASITDAKGRDRRESVVHTAKEIFLVVQF